MARVKKSREQRIKELDEKIAFYKEKISELELKKQELMAPSPAEIIAMAKKNGMTIMEIMDILGVSPQD